MKDNNRRTGSSRQEFRFLDEMDEILGERDCIDPTDTINADDEAEEEETEDTETVVVNQPRTKKSKQAVLSETIKAMQENIAEQNHLFEQQTAQDNEFMRQFIASNERSEQTQRDILSVTTELIRK